MDIRELDLNLLVVFDVMLEHRSVTRAGEAIGLSQPAMSSAVRRLREVFDDQLFVKSGSEMKATPRALELATSLRLVIHTIKEEILQRSKFDAASTDRVFTIITPDIGEIYFVPQLLHRLAQVAPAARLRTVSLPRIAAAEALESGMCQLAVGYFPDLTSAGFFQQKLFVTTHVCIVRSGNTAVGDELTAKQYLALSHAVVRPEGREHMFDEYLRHHGYERKIVLELSSFMSLLPIIETSDLIATVPQHWADICRHYGGVRILDVPLKAPPIPVHQFWHRLFHHDPPNVWLRSIVYGLFAKQGAGLR